MTRRPLPTACLPGAGHHHPGPKPQFHSPARAKEKGAGTHGCPSLSPASDGSRCLYPLAPPSPEHSFKAGATDPPWKARPLVGLHQSRSQLSSSSGTPEDSACLDPSPILPGMLHTEHWPPRSASQAAIRQTEGQAGPVRSKHPSGGWLLAAGPRQARDPSSPGAARPASHSRS